MVIRRLGKPYYCILIAVGYIGLAWLLLTGTAILIRWSGLHSVPAPTMIAATGISKLKTVLAQESQFEPRPYFHISKDPPDDFREYMVDYIRQYRLTGYDPRLPTNYSASRDAWEVHNKEWTQPMPKFVQKRLKNKVIKVVYTNI